MECVLCIKRRLVNYDKTGKVAMDLHTQCVAGEVEAADVNVYMSENTISISGGLEKMLSDAMSSGFLWIVDRTQDHRTGEDQELYVESIELNGIKIFDIDDCRGLLKRD